MAATRRGANGNGTPKGPATAKLDEIVETENIFLFIPNLIGTDEYYTTDTPIKLTLPKQDTRESSSPLHPSTTCPSIPEPAAYCTQYHVS